MAENKHNIKVYTTESCPYCHMVKDFLKENNLKFEEVDVGSDIKQAQEMIKKSGQMSVPVIDIDGKIIIGFDKSKIKETLGINGYQTKNR